MTNTATTAKPESHLPAVLIVEDETGPRDSLKMILKQSFNTYAVDNADTAVQVLNTQHIDLVTLDLKMPGRHGMDLLRQMRRDRHAAAVIIITGYGTLASAMEGIQHGVAGYLTKPFDVVDVITTVNHTLEKKHSHDRHQRVLEHVGNLWEHEHDIPAVLTRLSALIEAKDPVLAHHGRRTQFYTTLLADQLSLDDTDRDMLDHGAFIHDSGMLGIQNDTFTPTGALDEREWDVDQHHAEIGARMAESLGFPPQVCHIVRHHHEHFDGSGSPEGLKGDDIPLLTRIVTIAQGFDHMIAGSHQQAALSRIEATRHIREQAGIHFDPELVDLFTRVVR